MSFSKARLRRFNEEIPQVPSPGRYDPKLDTSVKGAILPTSKRFPGQNTTSSSLDNIEKASTASSEVVFRTPQVMRKVLLTPRLQYLKEKNFDTSGSDILSSEERPHLKSAIKKAVSKADYRRLEDELRSLADKHHNMILEREMEVNMLKEEIKEIKIHEAELKEILEEKSKLASDRYTEALQLKDNLETMVEKIKVDREEHQRFINDLKSEILELQNKKYELETVLAEKQSVIVTINDKCTDLENELKSLQEENLMLEKANSCILLGAEDKLQQLDEKVNSKLQTLPTMFDEKYEEEQISFQTKMNFVAHEFNLKSQEVIESVKESQEKVKELERLIDKKVKEFSEDIKEADERCKYLYRELCKVEEQRDELVVSDLEKKLAIIDIQEKSDSYQSELDQCRNTCRKYQVTLNTMNDTITALSSRLLESEQEVERLNVVEKDLESQKHLLEEKAQILLDDIIALRESMDKMEEEIIRDVSTLKEYLEAKADLFKEEAVKTEQALNKKIYEKQCAIEILLNENEYFKKEVERKDVFIEDLRKREKKNEESIKKLKSEFSKLEEELSEKLSAQKNLCKILNDKLESTNALVSDLQHLKLQHESRITSLVKQVDEYKSASLLLEKSNSEHTSVIQSLQLEIERKKEVEVKQQQYIDELISDLVLEKERSEAVETEKVRMQGILHNAEVKVVEKSEEVEKLLSHIESLKRSLKNSEEKISLTEEEKVMLEQQLIEAENNIMELKKLNSELQLELETKVSDMHFQLGTAIEKLLIAENSIKLDSEVRVELESKISNLECQSSSTKEKLMKAENKIIELKNLDSEVQVELENKICDLQSQLSSTKEKLVVAENNIVELKKLGSEVQTQLECKISDLQCQLSSAKERVKTEIPKLERDNINKAENILELNLSIDSLKEDMDLLKTRISCLEAEKDSLKNVLEESKSKISDLESTIEDKNLTINALNEDKIRLKTHCEDLFSQLDSLSVSLKKQNEELKRSAESKMQLIVAEEKVSDLEAQLLEKDKEVEILTQRLSEVQNTLQLEEVYQMREKLEDLQVKYKAVLEDRDKLSHEVGELMGHQNIHQKIKHVAELKQNNIELKDENDVLRLENFKLKSKLESMKKQSENNKENYSVSRKEDKQKTVKPGSAKKKPMSPVVLKPFNH